MCPKVSEAYREATRNEIVRAARKVFAKKGYQAASMDDIVAESRLSKGALYGYFDSKEDLFLAVRASVLEFDLEPALAAMPPTMSPLEKLLKAGEMAIRATASLDRDVLRVSYEFWTSAPRIRKLQQYYNELYHRNHRLLVELLREGRDRGDFRQDLDCEALAWSLLAVVDGLGLHAANLELGVDFDWRAVERAFLSVVQHGILSPPRRLPRAK